MDVVVSVRHFELEEDVKRYAVNQANAAFGEFRLKISGISIVLDMQKNQFKASITVDIKDNPVCADSALFDAPCKAIDEAIGKAENQARRYIDKKQGHRVQGLKVTEQEQLDK